MAAGQAPVSFPYLMILALPGLGLLWLGARSAPQALAVGAAAGFAYFCATMSWIVEPFLVRPDIHGWMALPALAAMALGMAIFWAAPFWAAHRAFLGGPMELPALACLWTLSELARSTVFTGFPWGLLAYSWSETAVIQLAAYAGPHGLGLLTLLVLLLPAMRRIRPAHASGWRRGGDRGRVRPRCAPSGRRRHSGCTGLHRSHSAAERGAAPEMAA